jgi:Flp pilus assembly protein TadD
MAKKKKQRKPRQQRPPQGHKTWAAPPQRLLASLDEVDRLTHRKKWKTALELLQELEQEYPRQPAILVELVNVCYELQDLNRYLYYIELLAQFPPVEPEITFNLAGAYLSNAYPSLAMKTYQRFIAQYPTHELADQARQNIVNLQTVLAELLQEIGAKHKKPFEILARHDEIQLRMSFGQYQQARKIAIELLRLDPDFIPVRNNLSLVETLEGNMAQAIKHSQHVLAVEPDNYQALGNLVRCYVFLGDFETARLTAAKLKPLESDADSDFWLKSSEAFSYVGDDQAVLATFNAAREAGHLDSGLIRPLLYHLTAAAAMRLGDEAQAKKHWQTVLDLDPGFDLARQNLADLNLPVGERHAPWAFDLKQWISERATNDLVTQWQAALRHHTDEAMTRAARRYLKQYPQTQALLPVLLERGDPAGRQFAFDLIKLAETPELLALLPDFALSRHGPDKLRHEALNMAKKAGLLPAGLVKMWVNGQQHEVMLVSFEIHDEPIKQHSPEVTDLAYEAILALRQDDGVKAEQLLRQALALEPDAPDLLNNLAMAYQVQKRQPEVEALINQIYQDHPDYFFGRVGMGNLLTQQGDLDQAAEMLLPLLSHERLHITEFTALATAYIQLYLAKDMPDAAQHWVDMWANIDPDSVELEQWRLRLRIHGWPKLPNLFKRSTRSK